MYVRPPVVPPCGYRGMLFEWETRGKGPCSVDVLIVSFERDGERLGGEISRDTPMCSWNLYAQQYMVKFQDPFRVEADRGRSIVYVL